MSDSQTDASRPTEDTSSPTFVMDYATPEGPGDLPQQMESITRKIVGMLLMLIGMIQFIVGGLFLYRSYRDTGQSLGMVSTIAQVLGISAFGLAFFYRGYKQYRGRR